MAEALELKAWARPRSGKGGARVGAPRGAHSRHPLWRRRRPAVHLAVDDKAIKLQLLTGHFQSTIFTLDVEGKKTRVIPRGVQLDPVRDFPIHVDFMRVGKDALVTVAVPVHFLNEAASPGIKRGGMLEHRPPRDRGALPGRRHPQPFRCRPDRSRDRRLRAHLGDEAAGRREAHHHRAQLHRGHHRRPRRRGRGHGAAAAAVVPEAGAEAAALPRAPRAREEGRSRRRTRRRRSGRRRNSRSFFRRDRRRLRSEPSTRMTR